MNLCNPKLNNHRLTILRRHNFFAIRDVPTQGLTFGRYSVRILTDDALG